MHKVQRRFATFAEAAVFIGSSSRTVRRMADRGLIHAYQVDGLRGARVDLEELEQAVRQSARPVAAK